MARKKEKNVIEGILLLRESQSRDKAMETNKHFRKLCWYEFDVIQIITVNGIETNGS